MDAFGGYTSAPELSFKQARASVRRGCDACAILVRDRRVDSVIVLDPGVGYGMGDDPIVPIVEIEPPKRLKKKVEPQQQQGNVKGEGSEAGTAPDIEMRTAVAVADIEYEIVGAG